MVDAHNAPTRSKSGKCRDRDHDIPKGAGHCHEEPRGANEGAVMTSASDEPYARVSLRNAAPCCASRMSTLALGIRPAPHQCGYRSD